MRLAFNRPCLDAFAWADSFYHIQSKRVDVRLREVGRFASRNITSDCEKEQPDALRVKSIVDYVASRQNADGGYAFARGLESNTQDTYYGLAILGLLKAPFPNATETIRWLRDFVPDSHYSHYYVAKALELCGEATCKALKDFLMSLKVSKGQFGTVDVYVEVASEFEATSMIAELVSMAHVEIDRAKMVSWLLGYQNDDGGFGGHGHSNLNSTYHAIASLSNLGYPIKSLKKILGFVRSCELPSGVFAVVLGSAFPYMECEYYGVSTLDLLCEHVRYPRETARFVLGCQNSSGGFARSDLGISTFEDTFYAVSILRKIGRLQR